MALFSETWQSFQLWFIKVFGVEKEPSVQGHKPCAPAGAAVCCGEVIRMLMKLSQLTEEEKAILARLKAWLALQLAAEAFRNDASLRELGPVGGVSLKLKIMQNGAAGHGENTDSIGRRSTATNLASNTQLLVKKGIASVGVRGWPQLVLFFPGREAAIKVLSGGKGAALPVPLSPGAFKALRFFKKASGRATELLREAQTPDMVRARLLLTATLHGLEAVSGDSYLERRMLIVPDGIVAVRVGQIEFFVAKRGRCITVMESARHPDAVLSFSDYQSAIKVLSGKRQAVVALGFGEVKIEGLLPLVQGLFAVLDRLSWYLGVSV